jgi:hypothetical protein
VESATDIALIVTVVDAETVAGAVYIPDADMVPTVVLPPATLLTLQVTDAFEEPVTEAANVCVIPA